MSDDLHVIVYTAGDVVFVATVVFVAVTAIAMVAYVAGHNAGVRAQQAATQRRDRAEMNRTAALYKRGAR
ncbi:hypothetical protein E1287_22550 [Actinomadura sp. KC06]|uniref:hypothetical protein n=1 Tax=Actinomadura sp. KC06 TaxID=2530369 RepID=UPI00104E5CDB|nr:hypothetical protein [Actinomadura sp. KC06]TDD32471.1 hypothetical protein E1287_22550 [Actinomadura sp. KC06]